MVRLQGSSALDVLDVILLEQELDSVRQTAHLAMRHGKEDAYGLLFGLHDSLEVERHVSDNDSVLFHRALRLIIPRNENLHFDTT